MCFRCGLVLYANVFAQFWKDDQLTWNTKDYEGTADVTLPLVSIWSPDIRLINAWVLN